MPWFGRRTKSDELARHHQDRDPLPRLRQADPTKDVEERDAKAGSGLGDADAVTRLFDATGHVCPLGPRAKDMTRLFLGVVLGYYAGTFLANRAEAQACETELLSCADELGEAEVTLKRAQEAVQRAELVQASIPYRLQTASPKPHVGALPRVLGEAFPGATMTRWPSPRR